MKTAAVPQESPHGLNIELLDKTFNALAPSGEKLVRRFYQELFKRHPDVKPMFGKGSIIAQQKKLFSALQLVVNCLRNPPALEQALKNLSIKRDNCGAMSQHFGLVAETMLDVMEEFAGDIWTLEVHDAWSDALNLVTTTMLKGYQDEKVKNADVLFTSNAILSNIDIMKDVLEHAPLNIMMADADENVIFVNKQARDSLTAAESDLAMYVPGFKVSEMIGGSIHRYHKDPAVIKRILDGLKPGESREGETHIGPFIFEYETRVLFDRANNLIGFVVQWVDVTEQRARQEEVFRMQHAMQEEVFRVQQAKKEEAFRLQRAIDGSQTAMMNVDRDFVITYANDETVALVHNYAAELAALYPGFNPDNLIGSCIDIFHKNPDMQRRLLSNPANLPHQTDIQVGPLTFHTRVTAITDLNGEYIGNTLEWADVTDLRRKELELSRLTSAVSGATANLMLCDQDLNITYANPAVVNMLKSRKDALQKRFPGFDPANLIGQCIDQFHENPQRQRTLLTNIDALPATAQIEVAGLYFEVNATAIVSPDGQYMGNMIEWKDITEQKDAEIQIERLVSGAIAGDIDKRLDTSVYSGYMRTLGDGINSLLEAVVVPLKESIDLLSGLAEGDLTHKMDGEYQGQFEVLSNSINTTVSNLADVVNRILVSSMEIKSASGEISRGNTDLSRRTEEQASSLKETASSIEELTGTVKQNADNTQQAHRLAANARAEAENGGEVVGKAVAAMGEINAASKKISDIIGVIDEIAFQTNLLALNAAVEAARAGEQGRGFAVVAAEVRNLAQRSATAAKEIKGLINDSVEKVSHGTELVDSSGKLLEEIVSSIKKVNDIIAEIAAASREQSTGIDQVNKAITQMDKVTQQNAVLVEEAAAGSASLNDQAINLNEMMTIFKLSNQ